MSKRAKILTTKQKTVVSEKLVELVKRNPSNIDACFRLVAKTNNITKHQVKNLYYTKKGLRALTPMFLVHTDYGMGINVKRSSVIKETKRTLKVEQVLHKVNELEAKDRLAFIDILLSNKI